MVDCCGEVGEYTKWFPLLAADAQLTNLDGEGGKGLYPRKSEKDRWVGQRGSTDDRLEVQGSGWLREERTCLPPSRVLSGDR